MREAPLMTAAIEALPEKPDLILVDGHGVAHPRRAGLAVFVGLVLDTPSVGVTKSLLVGEIGEEDGFAPILLDGSVVGFRVDVGGRRRFVSSGYGVRLDSVREAIGVLGTSFSTVLSDADRYSRESLR
jgi:deoxyribonuclease V